MSTRTVTETEFGLTFVAGMSFDMSANTSLTFKFKRPDDTVLTVAGVLGTVENITSAGTFAADEWASYTFTSGDIPLDSAGTWTVQLTYVDAVPKNLLSTIAQMTVDGNIIV